MTTGPQAVADTEPRTPTSGVTTRTVRGWGRTAPTAAQVLAPRTVDEVQAAVSGRAGSGRAVLARGLGRSYGDAAQSAGGLLLDLSAFDGVDIDPGTGHAVLGAGATLGSVMRRALSLGWALPVLPGTAHVTVGGATAADVHGKNHHRDGSWGHHVLWLDLVDGRGEVRRLAPDAPDPVVREQFWATVGGLGLTGVITRVAVALRRCDSPWVNVTDERVADLGAALSRLRAVDADMPLTVAWIDVLARGRGLGRGIVSSARPAERPLTMTTSGVGAYDPGRSLRVPPLPLGVINRLTMTAFAQAWFRAVPATGRQHTQRIDAFLHPLDGVRDWNRVYGPTGFVQYQLVVPDGREDVVESALAAVRRHSQGSFLTVLKRFGPGNPAPLSFPRRGWTLAVDIPVARAPDLAAALDRLDEQVAHAGGAVYLVKDARCRPDLLETMYPQLPQWRTVRDRLDPDRRFRSDLSRRVAL